MKLPRWIVAGIVLSSYITLVIFSLMMVSHAHHSAPTFFDACPFVSGQQSVCGMSFVDHGNAWWLLVNAVSSVFVFAASAFLFTFFLRDLLLQHFRRRNLHRVVPHESLFARLFSQGILNPKPY